MYCLVKSNRIYLTCDITWVRKRRNAYRISLSQRMKNKHFQDWVCVCDREREREKYVTLTGWEWKIKLD